MEITPAARPGRRDLTIIEAVLPQKLFILPGYRTRTGTPLTIQTGGWRPVKAGETPIFFASAPCDGGDQVMAFRSIIVETHVRDLQIGRVSINDVDDQGVVSFRVDENGPFLALTPSRVLLG